MSSTQTQAVCKCVPKQWGAIGQICIRIGGVMGIGSVELLLSKFPFDQGYRSDGRTIWDVDLLRFQQRKG